MRLPMQNQKEVTANLAILFIGNRVISLIFIQNGADLLVSRVEIWQIFIGAVIIFKIPDNPLDIGMAKL